MLTQDFPADPLTVSQWISDPALRAAFERAERDPGSAYVEPSRNPSLPPQGAEAELVEA